MVSGKRPPSDNPGARRKRPPTVIDLEATEVPSEAGAPEPQPETAVSPDAPPVGEAASDSAPGPEASDEPSPPPREPPSSATQEPQSDRRSPSWRLGAWSHVAAGVAGTAGALVVVLLLWAVGVFSSGGGQVQQVQSTDLSPRLAVIEKQLEDLADRPHATVDPTTVDALSSRLTKLENAQATPRPPVTDPVVLGRLGSTENALKSLSDNVGALSRRTDAAEAALRDANGKIDKLAATLAEVQTTARSAAAGSDRASRLALAAAALRDAVDHGQPFVAALAVAKPLAPDTSLVAALEPFAASGVPSDAALAKELAGIVQPILRASEEKSPGGSFLDRLQASAEKLVRIERVDAPRGDDDRGAALSRIGRYASQGNVAAAMNELAALPADARAPMLGWMSRVEARNKAVEASRRLAASAIAALKATP